MNSWTSVPMVVRGRKYTCTIDLVEQTYTVYEYGLWFCSGDVRMDSGAFVYLYERRPMCTIEQVIEATLERMYR